MRLLSIDWDYFFQTMGPHPEFYDWGHSEGFPQTLQDILWTQRAADFIRCGMELPRCNRQEGFLKPFRFSDDCRLYVTESHCRAVNPEVAEGITEVVNFDAHHDCGYSKNPLDAVIAAGSVSCEDWMVAYSLDGSTLAQFYPPWIGKSLDDLPEGLYDQMKDRVELYIFDEDAHYAELEEPFDAVLIARSGSWVPPWNDDQFRSFIQMVSSTCKADIQFIGDDFEVVRPFDIKSAHDIVEMYSKFETGSIFTENNGGGKCSTR